MNYEAASSLFRSRRPECVLRHTYGTFAQTRHLRQMLHLILFIILYIPSTNNTGELKHAFSEMSWSGLQVRSEVRRPDGRYTQAPKAGIILT